jgi:predicted aldo/keto reductase-like oxidoreductase
METRSFGKTGLKCSLLGFGGFHLLEIDQQEASKLLNSYLDAGGSYVETAASYGDGESERKVGLAISHRRSEYMLVSKSNRRDKASFLYELNRSLKNLRTDHLDVILMHGVANRDELDQILAPGGAMEGFIEAREQGKVNFVGLSMHGQSDILIEALQRYQFDAVMATINYYDRFNFPEIENKLIPLANEQGCAIILMKPVGDGLLWRSAPVAFRYAFSQPVSVVVAGMNTREMLELDLKLAEEFKPMSEAEKESLYQDAPELGNYVCRQCDKCLPCPENINIPHIFMLEGYFDRQMRDGDVRDPAEFALRDRLRFWFGNSERAQAEYEQLAVKVDACTKCGICSERCPYGIDVVRKLHIADYKLAGREIF